SFGPSAGVVSHFSGPAVIQLYGAPQGRDVVAVASDSRRIISETKKDVPPGSYVALRGQVQTMTSAYDQLYFGLAGAIVLIYLVIAVNFQSWLDPLIIISALPGALAGIVWMLFITETTLSVPALTGALMAMGFANANRVCLSRLWWGSVLRGAGLGSPKRRRSQQGPMPPRFPLSTSFIRRKARRRSESS